MEYFFEISANDVRIRRRIDDPLVGSEYVEKRCNFDEFTEIIRELKPKITDVKLDVGQNGELKRLILKVDAEVLRRGVRIVGLKNGIAEVYMTLPVLNSSSESWQLRGSFLGLPKNFKNAGNCFVRQFDRRKLLSVNCIN